MPRQKRTYRVLEKAELRMSGLKAIDPSMDFGDARNLQNITQIIQQYRSKIEAYNTTLALIDSYKNEMKDLETTLSDLTEKMLLGVAFKYGKDSYEYQMAGGVRKSDRIRKSRATRLRSTSEEAATKDATPA
ncbi:hypothetical protein IQ229_22955 [Nostoc cf. edaphicum LEGE 07299]|uniref:ATPase involved in DNA repair n=1 Tax=Nostoc cf. edaphicum LEGE 07299 TaxID=2777974 RepID=A0ABR9U5L0_9NOSO|nr:hypothetical protein [Nostoc edaphicum]MBE9107682.1 hypothetical protein [Nostoc cf. edaphicum LEGE 07299]